MQVKNFDLCSDRGQPGSLTLNTMPDSENMFQNKGIEHQGRPCKMKTEASTPHSVQNSAK